MHLDLSQKANELNEDVYNILKKDRLIRQAIKEKMQQDFLFFTQVIHHSIHKQKFKVRDFHKTIASALQRVATGDCNRLIINIPPRFGKTALAVKYFIAWVLANNDTALFLHTSNSQSLAIQNSSGVKEILTSDIYQLLWGYKFRGDASANEKWYIKQGGGMYATSHGGQIIGFGAGDMQASPFCGAMIIDDPLKSDDLNSTIERTKVNTRFDEVLVNRLNNERVPIIVIMQRLHEDDLTGYLLSKPNNKWEVIKIPVFNEEGKSIWEERFSTEYLQELQKDNAMSFAGQYLQEPAPAEGNIFKQDWIKWSDEKSFEAIYQSWDTAIKKEAQNDYSVCTTWGFKNNEFYLIDCFRDKLEFPELLRVIKSQYDKWKPRQIIIEDKASGSQLLQVLRRETQLPIVAYDVSGKGDKIARFNRITPKFESGRVNFNNGHFTNEVLTELKFFPNSKNDDIVDSISNFFNWFDTRINDFATTIMADDYVLE